MPEPTLTPTATPQTAPTAAEPPAPTNQVTPPQTAPPADPKTPPWGDDKNFDPAKAWELIENLRKEKTPDTKALETKVAEMQASAEARNKVLAEAFGLTEPPKTEDDLAETVKSLQDKFAASEREATKLRIAAEKGVPPQYLSSLTETDTEKLNAQAEMVAEYARLKAQAEGTPEFQANPGQGQGGTPSKSDEDRDYEALFGPPQT